MVKTVNLGAIVDEMTIKHSTFVEKLFALTKSRKSKI
jgi:hypothetical protein